MANILLIGGNGYIGSALFEHLERRGDAVESVDLCLYGKNRTRSWIMDYRALSAEDLSRFDVIVLLAGHTSFHSCLGDPLHSLDNNVRNFVDLLGKLGDQKLIYASSASVYGRVGDEAMCQEDNLRFTPICAYDVSKMILDYYAPLSRVQYYGLRLGSVNGWHCSPAIRGDNVVNAMVKSALTGQDILCMNPHLHRSILSLHDLCCAVTSVIDGQEDRRGIYNVASFNTTIGDIASAVHHKTGAPVVTQHDPSKVTYNFQCDTRLFEKTFSFSFEDTMGSIIDSLIAHFPSLDYTYRSEILPYVYPS